MKSISYLLTPIKWIWKLFIRNKGKIILLLIASAGAYRWFFMRTTTTTTTTRQITNIVKRGNLEKSIKVVGNAELIDEQKLRFNQVGEVTKVNVKIGDKVTKGQILAELDQTDAENSIKQSQISLDNSQLALQKLLEGSKQTEILQSKNNVESTKNKIEIAKQEYQTTLEQNNNNINNSTKNLEISKQELEKLKNETTTTISQKESEIEIKKQQISQQEKALEILKNDLELLKEEENKNVNDQNISVNKTVDDAITDSRKYLNDAKKQLETVDQIFGISTLNRDKNDEYENYLSAKNTGLKTEVEATFFKVTKLLNDAENLYSEIISSKNPSKDKINTLLESTKSMNDNMINLMNVAKDAVTASLANSSYPQTKIDSHESSIISARSQAQTNFDNIKKTIETIATMSDIDFVTKTSNTTITKKEKEITDTEINLKSSYNSLNSLQDDLNNTKKDYSIKLETQQNTITKLEKDIELSKTQNVNTQSSKQNDINNLQENLKVYEESYQDTIDGADSTDIQQAQNNIEKSKLALENAQTALDKYKIEAPFDGIVRSIDFKIGDKITSDEQKYIYLENPNLLKMTALVDQIDVVNISIGQGVRIVFDSYSETNLTGVVSNIDTTAQTSAGVVSYEINVTLDKKELNILNGMTAKMYIQIQKKDNVISIPTSYISSKGNKKIVLVKENEKIIPKRITTGITDGTNTEIIEGLNEGDTIVQSVTISSSGSSSSTTGLFTPGSNKNKTSSGSRSNDGGGGMPPG